MARGWRKKEIYNIPIVAEAGVSHYLKTRVTWLKVKLDEGAMSVQIGKFVIVEQNYGEA